MRRPIFLTPLSFGETRLSAPPAACRGLRAGVGGLPCRAGRSPAAPVSGLMGAGPGVASWAQDKAARSASSAGRGQACSPPAPPWAAVAYPGTWGSSSPLRVPSTSLPPAQCGLLTAPLTSGLAGRSPPGCLEPVGWPPGAPAGPQCPPLCRVRGSLARGASGGARSGGGKALPGRCLRGRGPRAPGTTGTHTPDCRGRGRGPWDLTKQPDIF